MKMRLLLALIALIPTLALAQAAPAQATRTDFVTDMTRDHVDISARYTGDEITLFGAMSEPAQVIVKVSSPTQSLAIKQKGRVGPFWLSVAKYDISDTPGLYFLLSSKPIDQLLSTTQQRQYGLDLDDALSGLHVQPKPADLKSFTSALLRLKKVRHQYVINGAAVKIRGGRLFSATIRLPAQLPLGLYGVDIYLVQGGQVVATEHRQIKVSEVDLEYWVSHMANNYPWLFGVFFTLAVLVLGLILGIVMGRGRKKA